MELRTFVVPRKNLGRDKIYGIIVKLVLDEEKDEDIIFTNNEPFNIDIILPNMDSLHIPISPKPLKHQGYNIYNDIPEPLKEEDAVYLKEYGCSIAKLTIKKGFTLRVDNNSSLSDAQFFAKIISKQMKYQLNEYMKNIYAFTTEITIGSP